MWDVWMMRAGLGVSLWKLAWWSLNVRSQKHPSNRLNWHRIQHIARLTVDRGTPNIPWADMTDISHNRMMGSYVILVAAVGGTDGLIQRRRDMTLWRVRVGVFSLCLCLSVSSSCRSSILSPSDCLLRLTAAGVSRCSCTTRPPVETERPWCALIRSPSSARQPPRLPPALLLLLPTKRACAWPRARARVCVCMCVQMGEWVPRFDRVSHPAEPDPAPPYFTNSWLLWPPCVD